MMNSTISYIQVSLAILVWCVARGSATIAERNNPVRVLTDATFEHVTQASTGQTTGTWTIRLCGSKESNACGPSDSFWESLAESMLEEHVFLATVNVGRERGLATRFGTHLEATDHPVVVLLRRGKMFVRPLEPSTESTTLGSWMTVGWEDDNALEVPGEAGWLDTFWLVEEGIRRMSWDRLYLVMVVVMMIIIGIWCMRYMGKILGKDVPKTKGA